MKFPDLVPLVPIRPRLLKDADVSGSRSGGEPAFDQDPMQTCKACMAEPFLRKLGGRQHPPPSLRCKLHSLGNDLYFVARDTE